MGYKIVERDLINFLKMILINIGIHICWLLLYVFIDTIEIIVRFDFVYQFCNWTFNNQLLFSLICGVIFNIIIYKIYKKNPCYTKLGASAYWLISLSQTICLIML